MCEHCPRHNDGPHPEGTQWADNWTPYIPGRLSNPGSVARHRFAAGKQLLWWIAGLGAAALVLRGCVALW